MLGPWRRGLRSQGVEDVGLSPFALREASDDFIAGAPQLSRLEVVRQWMDAKGRLEIPCWPSIISISLV